MWGRGAARRGVSCDYRRSVCRRAQCRARPFGTSTAATAGSKARTYRLLSTKAVAKTRRKVTLRLRLTKAAIKAVKQGLGSRRRSTARVTIIATDAAGNKRSVGRQIAIKK